MISILCMLHDYQWIFSGTQQQSFHFAVVQRITSDESLRIEEENVKFSALQLLFPFVSLSERTPCSYAKSCNLIEHGPSVHFRTDGPDLLYGFWFHGFLGKMERKLSTEDRESCRKVFGKAKMTHDCLLIVEEFPLIYIHHKLSVKLCFNTSSGLILKLT